MIPLIPRISNYFSIPPNIAQLIVPTFYFGLMGAQLIVGYFSERYGRKLFFIIGLVITALGALLVAVTPGIRGVLCGFLVQAMGIGFIAPISSNIVTDVFEEKIIPSIFSLTCIATGSGSILAPIIATTIAFYFHWQWLFAIIAMIAIMFAVVSKFYLYESSSTTSRIGLLEYFRRIFYLFTCFKNKKLGFFPAIISFSGLYSGSIIALYTSYSVILSHQFHRNLLYLGHLFALASFFYLLGIIMSKPLSNKFQIKNILRFCVYFAMLASFMMMMHNFINTGFQFDLHFLLFFFLLYLFVLSFFCGVVLPCAMTLALAPFSNSDENSSAAASIQMFSYNVFTFILGLVISIFHEESSLPLAFTLLISFGIAAIFLEIYCNKYRGFQ